MVVKASLCTISANKNQIKSRLSPSLLHRIWVSEKTKNGGNNNAKPLLSKINQTFGLGQDKT
jgi:hypothetical protein